MTTLEQIDNFHRFAMEQIDNRDSRLSMDELYGLWRAQNPSAEEFAESVAAIKAAYADFESGETGEPARTHLRNTCERLGLVIDE